MRVKLIFTTFLSHKLTNNNRPNFEKKPKL